MYPIVLGKNMLLLRWLVILLLFSSAATSRETGKSMEKRKISVKNFEEKDQSKFDPLTELTETKSSSSQTETNQLSNDHDITSFETSSSTFHENLSKQRKSNISNTLNNRSRKVLQNIIMMLVKTFLRINKFNTRNQTSGTLYDKTALLDATRKSILIPGILQTNRIKDEDLKISNDKLQKKEFETLMLIAMKKKFKFLLNQYFDNYKYQSNDNSLGKAEKKFNQVRMKRESVNRKTWITKEFEGKDDILKMHAYVIKDEDIPQCCSVANPVSKKRYFMCSAAILTLKHVITTASCVHFADVYENHIVDDLAVIVGAFTSNPYVIKVNRFEMHPNYVYHIQSREHATHNLAILFLSCSLIAEFSSVPRLPMGQYDDVGHMCCGQTCELVTIIQTFDNSHFGRLMTAKHLPSPMHDDVTINPWAIGGNERRSQGNANKIFQDVSLPPRRRVRRSGKLAGTPQFLLQNLNVESTTESQKKVLKHSKRKRISNIFDEIENARKSGNANTSNTNSRKKKNTTTTRKKSNSPNTSSTFSNIKKDLPLVDWKDVGEEMASRLPNFEKSKLDKFAKHLVNETMKRLGSVLHDRKLYRSRKGGQISRNRSKDSEDDNFFMSHLPDGNSTNIPDFANVILGVIKSVIPPNYNGNLSVQADLTVDEKNVSPPPARYTKCPPLGSPIIKNGMLIGMVAYTCDDAQSWVEWKYVSISKNTNWIRSRIAAIEHETRIDCGLSSNKINYGESVVGGDSRNQDSIYETNGLTNERKLREYLPRIASQYKPISQDVKPKSNQHHESQANYYNPQSFVDHVLTTLLPPIPIKASGFSAVSNINANTCFTKPDGSTDCRSITNTYTVQ